MRPPRSAALTLTQGILGLESLAALFAASLLSGFERAGDVTFSQSWIWGLGLGLTLALALATGVQGRPWGRWLGWLLQAPMLLAAGLSLAVAFVGSVFVGLWIAAIRIGDRIDKERAAYNAAPRRGNGVES